MRKKNMPGQRNCNIYIDALPVAWTKQGELFSKELTWDVFNALREAGARGLTAKEVREKFRLTSKGEKPAYKYPTSTIYKALNDLEQMRVINAHRATLDWGGSPHGERKRIGRNGAGRPLRIYTAAILSSPEYSIEDGFYNDLQPILNKYVPEIRKVWVELLQKIVNEFKTEDLQKHFPQDMIHDECDLSHEGYEFITAISLAILAKIEEGDKWKDFARKAGFMK